MWRLVPPPLWRAPHPPCKVSISNQSGGTMRLKTILIALAVVTLSFYASLKIMDWLSPAATVGAPALVALPPLPPVSRSSSIIAQTSISLAAIRDAADRSTPRDFVGKADNPVSQLLQDADIGWTTSRGPITASGGQDVLSLATPLTGTLNVTGSLSSKATDAVGNALGSLLGGNVAKQVGSINIKALNASAEIKGNVAITSRPKLAAAWHIEPNLAGQVTLGDTNLSMAGVRVNVPAQVKPLIDKTVADQLAAAGERIRTDPSFERSARAQWAKACRSIPLQDAGTAAALPPLWLELRPTRAIAAQPRVDASAVTLTLGIEAETRITSTQTKPDCPFPEKISIVPPTPSGVSIGVPIDMPFTDINKILEAQFVGRTVPEDGSGSVNVTVKHATLAASGDRLLISLLVNAKEKKSWFGLGGEATVHIWGRPALDLAQQTLRLTDIQLAVESEAAFGLLGAAAREAMPHLQKVLAEQTTVDLKPFAANAQKKIAAAIADFQKSEEGVRVAAEITSLRLADIAFDSKTLRVIAEADGTINVYVTALRGL
jgi:predicted small integral membrane protein